MTAVKGDIGYPSEKPCEVCGGHDENQEEASRFGYVVCKKHRDVPPAYLSVAALQYTVVGYTEWDRK
jgi:hypothetical protein